MSATCWPTEPIRCPAAATASRSIRPSRTGSHPGSRLRTRSRRFLTASAPVVPASAAPPTIRGAFARRTAAPTARPAALVPAAAASRAAVAGEAGSPPLEEAAFTDARELPRDAAFFGVDLEREEDFPDRDAFPDRE